MQLYSLVEKVLYLQTWMCCSVNHSLRQKHWHGALCWWKMQGAEDTDIHSSWHCEDGELLLFLGGLIIVALIWGTDLFCTQYVAISSSACSCSHRDCFFCWEWSEGLQAVRWGEYQQCYFSSCQRQRQWRHYHISRLPVCHWPLDFCPLTVSNKVLECKYTCFSGHVLGEVAGCFTCNLKFSLLESAKSELLK